MKNPYGSIPYSTLGIEQLQAVADAQDNELAQELLTRIDALESQLKEWPDEDAVAVDAYAQGLAEAASDYQHAIRRTLRDTLELSEEKIEEVLDSIERWI